MTFVERVIREWFDDVEQAGTEVLRVAGCHCAFNKFDPLFGNEYPIFLSARFPEVICFSQGVPGDALSYTHN